MRLFAAVDVPEPHKLSIEKSLQEIRLLLPEAKWTPRQNWHVTLKFLGEVDDDRLGRVSEIIERCVEGWSPVTSRLTEVGFFPSVRRARVVWVGIEDVGSNLAALASYMEAEFAAAGFRQESRALIPHITVARLKTPGSLASKGALETGPMDETPFMVSAVTLYRSKLTRAGAEYEALQRFEAKGDRSSE